MWLCRTPTSGPLYVGEDTIGVSALAESVHNQVYISLNAIQQPRHQSFNCVWVVLSKCSTFGADQWKTGTEIYKMMCHCPMPYALCRQAACAGAA